MITARTGRGAAEITRHRLSMPGSPSICDEHYPDHPGGNGPRQPRLRRSLAKHDLAQLTPR